MMNKAERAEKAKKLEKRRGVSFSPIDELAAPSRKTPTTESSPFKNNLTSSSNNIYTSSSAFSLAYTTNLMNYKLRKSYLNGNVRDLTPFRKFPAKAAPLRDLLDNGATKHGQTQKFDAFIISETAETNPASKASTNSYSSSLLKDYKDLDERVSKQKEIYDNFKSKRSILNRRMPLASSQSTPNFLVQQQSSVWKNDSFFFNRVFLFCFSKCVFIVFWVQFSCL